jgi:hypothetical protein
MRARKAWVFPINFRAYYSPPTFVPRIAQGTCYQRSVFPRSVKAKGLAVRAYKVNGITTGEGARARLQKAAEIRRFIYLHKCLFDKDKGKFSNVAA